LRIGTESHGFATIRPDPIHDRCERRLVAGDRNDLGSRASQGMSRSRPDPSARSKHERHPTEERILAKRSRR
jgi:hypothetical protein